jgi:hypothetical protein
MLKTIAAEINTDGTVTLLEPVRIEHRSRAIVTVLEDTPANGKRNVSTLRKLINDRGFRDRPSRSSEEIESQIDEARHSWE